MFKLHKSRKIFIIWILRKLVSPCPGWNFWPLLNGDVFEFKINRGSCCCWASGIRCVSRISNNKAEVIRLWSYLKLMTNKTLFSIQCVEDFCDERKVNWRSWKSLFCCENLNQEALLTWNRLMIANFCRYLALTLSN